MPDRLFRPAEDGHTGELDYYRMMIPGFVNAAAHHGASQETRRTAAQAALELFDDLMHRVEELNEYAIDLLTLTREESP